jgi:NADH-ubiquinone oxidoreductase chain 2
MGTLIRISSFNWLYVWIGLEINLISFIPLIISSSIDIETERSLKYFLVQALGSGLLLFGSLVYINYPNCLILDWMSVYIILFRLIIKLGIAPFHFWLPHVMSGIRWMSCILLSIWQKVGPLFILSSFIYYSSFYIILVCCLRALVGGLGGINQTQMRVLLAYSSIGHMGWMFARIIYSFRLFLVYFLVYRLINISIILLIDFTSLKITNLIRVKGLRIFIIVILCFLFLSLAGLPPFLGFFPKWMVIIKLIEDQIYILRLVLIFGSLLNIYYYLNIFFNIFINSFFGTEVILYKRIFDIKIFLFMFSSLIRTFFLGLGYILIYAMVLFYKS